MFLILPEIAAIMIRAAMLGKTQIQIEPTPMSRNKPVASRSALALIHEAAVDRPMIPAPNSLPASQKSVTDFCLREVRMLMPTSIATKSTRKIKEKIIRLHQIAPDGIAPVYIFRAILSFSGTFLLAGCYSSCCSIHRDRQPPHRARLGRPIFKII